MPWLGLLRSCILLIPTELARAPSGPSVTRSPSGCSNAPAGYVPEFGVVGELVWLFWTAAATACAAVTAVFAAYRLASSWNFPMFFLYLILLLPNQLDTCSGERWEG